MNDEYQTILSAVHIQHIRDLYIPVYMKLFSIGLVQSSYSSTWFNAIAASSSGASFFAWGHGKSKARCLLPAFLCAHIFIERETSGHDADEIVCHKQYGETNRRAYSHDVTVAILVFQNNRAIYTRKNKTRLT